MGHRRSPGRVAAERAWQRFVEHNGSIITAAGLPPLPMTSVTAWDDFLMHGYVASDPGRFDVDHLTPAQYASLAELVSNYFAAGYEFYIPVALHVDDQAILRAGFDAGR